MIGLLGAVVVLLGVVVPAYGDDEPSVTLTVQLTDGTRLSPQRFTLTQLREKSDFGGRRPSYYRVIEADGTDSADRQGVGYGSTTLRTVLTDLVGVPPDRVSQVLIDRANAPGQVALSGAEIADPSGFEDSLPPVFFTAGDDGKISFIRAPRSGDPTPTRQDFFAAPTITGTVLSSGRVLRPDLVADASSVSSGTPVQLRIARYEDGQAPDGAVRYAWDFGNGDSSGPNASATPYTWTSSASTTYAVRVSVYQLDGGAAGVGTVEVTVNPSKGSGGTGGGGGGDENGPRTGAPGNGNQSGAAPGKGGTGSGGAGTSGTGTTGSNGGSASSAQVRKALQRARARQDGKSKDLATAPGGARVEGVLLDAEAASAVTAPSGSAAKVTSATTRRATEVPRDWRWLLGLVPFVLLLLGGARQTRWLTRRLPEPPWRQT